MNIYRKRDYMCAKENGTPQTHTHKHILTETYIYVIKYCNELIKR